MAIGAAYIEIVESIRFAVKPGRWRLGKIEQAESAADKLDLTYSKPHIPGDKMPADVGRSNNLK